MTNVIFDKRDQFDRIAAGLLEGETIVAVYDAIGGGTGFIGLTTTRVVIQDNSFLGKQAAVTSIPYSRIKSVSYVSDKNVFGKFASSSTVAIDMGGKTYEVTFRGEDKAVHAHNVSCGTCSSYPADKTVPNWDRARKSDPRSGSAAAWVGALNTRCCHNNHVTGP